ncbi:fumarylacetoacetate hydrolase family protein [Ideonella livida]|uniref:fumarylacetoacetate hydrolase family protein n=1 Tax=Ideonella livida TaxID=2707176 RepID=UPI002873CF56|nr:fumarylacetoacetate hydrolase family protein [Ideonella livida]
MSLPVAGRADRFPVGRVFCAGRNYPWPDAPGPATPAPIFFMKPACAVVEAAGSLPLPTATADFCPEVELVVALGQGGADLSPEAAQACIWGLAVGLDMTRRDLQRQARQQGLPWEAAKAFDGAAPCGPVHPLSSATRWDHGALWLQVNGQPRQHADLAEQFWPVPVLLSWLSRLFPLRAGDLVFTGSPAGVDTVQAGDTVSAGIAGLGQVALHLLPASASGPAPAGATSAALSSPSARTARTA